jgi:NAD(P)-dependent dehydrogenase (short-subunit alcohol dehydrogenase family)
MARKVLITGTTSGLGLALIEKYVALGWDVIAVNRRTVAEIESRFPSARFFLADIRNEDEVLTLCRTLQQQNLTPDVLVLNAGINREDNDPALDMNTFKEVFNINLYGTLSFVRAAQTLNWAATLVGISSTTTIVPNSKNLGYLVSKSSIRDLFKLLSKVDTKRRYKVVILGPVTTNLNSTLPPQQGLQKKVFAALSISPAKAAERCIRFIESTARISYPPLETCLFYSALKVAVLVKPSFYYKPYRNK